jgi:hypothetical protein
MNERYNEKNYYKNKGMYTTITKPTNTTNHDGDLVPKKKKKKSWRYVNNANEVERIK